MPDGPLPRPAAPTDLDTLRGERDAARADRDAARAERDALRVELERLHRQTEALEAARAAASALTDRLTLLVGSADAEALWRHVADVVTAVLGPAHQLCGIEGVEVGPPPMMKGGVLARSACAALRTGVPRLPGDGGCDHPRPARSACAPIIAQGEPVALVCFDIEHAPVGALDVLVAQVQRLSVAVEVVLLRLSLERAARIDPLTGLLNRGAFEIAAARIRARASRSGEPWSVILFDLDHFKRINDTGGHAEGDRVLVRVADEARGVIRESDVFGRVGGEEFAVVLESCDIDAAADRAEALRAAIATGVKSSAGPVTASLGVAEAPTGESEVWAVVRRADAAMYDAKAGGRDQVCRAAPGPAGAPRDTPQGSR